MKLIFKEYEDVVAAEGAEITYRYRYSKRRTLGISVRRDLSVMVTVPWRTTIQVIRDFVRERVSWILKAQQSLRLRSEPEPLTYRNGEIHRYMGNQYWLQVQQGQTNSVSCEGDCLKVVSKNEPTPAGTKHLLDTWYRKQASAVFFERLRVWHERLAGEGIPFPRLRIRRMKSRWGSCSRKGSITLNLLLIMTPQQCIDYVIVHELCHFKVMSHAPEFWNLVERFMPEYRQWRAKLNMHVH